MTLLILDQVKNKAESIQMAQIFFFISYNSHETIFTGKEDIKINMASTEEKRGIHRNTIDLGEFITLP